MGYVAAALVFATALSQSNLAHAAHGHGGGFHGGFHSGFHADGFRGGFAHIHHGFARVHRGFAHVHRSFADVHRGFGGWHGGGHGLWWGGLGLGLGWGLYPDHGYYDYGQPYAAQYRYYCSDPAGYYPQVTQCNTAWQTVPTG